MNHQAAESHPVLVAEVPKKPVHRIIHVRREPDSADICFYSICICLTLMILGLLIPLIVLQQRYCRQNIKYVCFRDEIVTSNESTTRLYANSSIFGEFARVGSFHDRPENSNAELTIPSAGESRYEDKDSGGDAYIKSADEQDNSAVNYNPTLANQSVSKKRKEEFIDSPSQLKVSSMVDSKDGQLATTNVNSSRNVEVNEIPYHEVSISDNSLPLSKLHETYSMKNHSNSIEAVNKRFQKIKTKPRVWKSMMPESAGSKTAVYKSTVSKTTVHKSSVLKSRKVHKDFDNSVMNSTRSHDSRRWLPQSSASPQAARNVDWARVFGVASLETDPCDQFTEDSMKENDECTGMDCKLFMTTADHADNGDESLDNYAGCFEGKMPSNEERVGDIANESENKIASQQLKVNGESEEMPPQDFTLLPKENYPGSTGENLDAGEEPCNMDHEHCYKPNNENAPCENHGGCLEHSNDCQPDEPSMNDMVSSSDCVLCSHPTTTSNYDGKVYCMKKTFTTVRSVCEVGTKQGSDFGWSFPVAAYKVTFVNSEMDVTVTAACKRTVKNFPPWWTKCIVKNDQFAATSNSTDKSSKSESRTVYYTTSSLNNLME